MIYVAWKMLTGDRAKYLSLVVGLAFAVLLMTQQGSIFTGIMTRTFAMVTDISAARVWVMDPGVQYPDDLKPLKDVDLPRVRDVPGVDWAVPLFKSNGRAKTADGSFQSVFVFGLDSGTLLGGPSDFVEGKLTDLWQPDAVIVDEAGAERLGGVKVGDVLELNDRRARVVGICRATRTFVSFPVVYTTYSRAVKYVPGDRRVMTFVLTSPKPGVTDEELADRIRAATGLGAATQGQFTEKTLRHYARNTGIVINFGTTVVLGFIVGLAIAMQTLHSFVVDNLRHFGTLKAMGAGNGLLAKMVVFQAVVVGLLGYGIGVGFTALFSHAAKRSPQIAVRFTPELMGLSFCAMTVLVALASLLSLRKVWKTEPAIVFRGS